MPMRPEKADPVARTRIGDIGLLPSSLENKWMAALAGSEPRESFPYTPFGGRYYTCAVHISVKRKLMAGHAGRQANVNCGLPPRRKDTNRSKGTVGMFRAVCDGPVKRTTPRQIISNQGR
jgi:hypothetical protein